MRFLLKAVGVLVLFGALAFVGYAVLFDLPPPEREVTVPVEVR